MARQFSLFEQPVAPRTFLQGFGYREEFITSAEQDELVEQIATFPFKEFEFQGYKGKRRIVSFGWQYDFNQGKLHKAGEIPGFLRELSRRISVFGFDPDNLQHVLVTEYAPGAGIGWHKDRPVFEDIVGLSLLSPCTFRLRRKVGMKWERKSFEMQPRSA